MYQVEICANSVESCQAAQCGGADRVELCAAIPEGGTTPSAGTIAVARKALTRTRLHVIIRPRGGDFLYSDTEIAVMLRDIETARNLGADGVVLGCLTADGAVDVGAMRELMRASAGLSVTFHRAFDVCRDPFEALEQIVSLGCQRILTSGQQPSADQGVALLKELQQRAAGRIVLMERRQQLEEQGQESRCEEHGGCGSQLPAPQALLPRSHRHDMERCQDDGEGADDAE